MTSSPDKAPPTPVSGPDCPPEISDYGLIGDLHTAALISKLGDVDFFCYPNFDSPTVFAALLDRERGGNFSVRTDLVDARHQQLYLPDTNILLTRLLGDSGILEITDFMPYDGERADRALIRSFDAVRGDIQLKVRCTPRLNYGRSGFACDRAEHDAWVVSDDAQQVVIRATSPLSPASDAVEGEFTLREGQTLGVVIGQADLLEVEDLDDWIDQRFRSTSNYWHGWSGMSTYRGRWREIVNRSALVLKLLTSHEHGSIIAAPTLGLPEEIGGPRNWDYRYSWVRDAAFTVFALNRLGYSEESEAFIAWLEKVTGEEGELRVVYRMDGHWCMNEKSIDGLSGYQNSKPVRVGNDAHDQFQLDIYGALIDAIHQSNKQGKKVAFDTWCNIRSMMEYLCEHWREPDHGIWEVRGDKRHFFHSRLMSWVALDRALKLADLRSLPHPEDHWRETRDEIYESLFRDFWDPKKKTFVQHDSTDAVDAAALMMPIMGAIAGSDPRWQGTLDAVQERLAQGALVFRYRLGETDVDPIDSEEASFTTCSFWFVEALARGDRLAEARLLFEKLLSYSNHLGLYAEELGHKGEHLGNFPQALPHLALISAAYTLDQMLDRHSIP